MPFEVSQPSLPSSPLPIHGSGPQPLPRLTPDNRGPTVQSRAPLRLDLVGPSVRSKRTDIVPDSAISGNAFAPVRTSFHPICVKFGV